jgi:hypothetical protein
MPSSAGNKAYYSFYGWDEEKQRVDRRTELRFPRVTTVIQDTVAKPALMAWAYRHTRDVISSIAGIDSVMIDDETVPMIEILSDGDWLEEFLKENELRPDDVALEAAVIGVERHALMEELGKLALGPSEDADTAKARVMLESEDGHERAIADWWLTRDPDVVASEVTLVSRRHWYAGTCDLVWYDGDRLTITDLKNRKADAPCAVDHRTEEAADRCHITHSYETDHIQVGAYDIAWNEEHPQQQAVRKTVLVAKADGRWVEDEVHLDSSIFLDYLSAWNKLKGAR